MSKTKDNQDKDVGHYKRYLVTTTLGKCLSSFKRIGLKIPEKAVIQEIERELIHLLNENFSGDPVTVEVIDFEDMCDEVVAIASKVKKAHPDAIIVSTAPLIAYEADGVCIHLNRIISFQGEIIGIGPRPGHPSVERQLRAVRNKPVIIIEDGSFTGRSLKFLLDRFSNNNIITIVLGIIFPEAKRSLEKVYDKDLFCCTSRSEESLLDWVPTHDFLPFVPNCGRIVGTHMGKSCFPFYLYDHASICMPYILPYGKPKEWASLRGERDEVGAFSSACINLSRRIFSEMECANGKELLVRDIIHSNPATSVPVSIGQNDFSDGSERVIDILTEDLKFLS